jgi:hypothetical protein
VAYYNRKVADKDIKRLSEDVPCAEGFNGDGYAFFPGTSAENGEEMILTNPIAGCDVGLHTVRFRYLASQVRDLTRHSSTFWLNLSTYCGTMGGFIYQNGSG